MANIKSAIKRARQNEKRRMHNKAMRSALRTAIKKFEQRVQDNDLEGAKEALSLATKKLDKAASKGLIHKNMAARKKSRLMKQLHQMGSDATAS